MGHVELRDMGKWYFLELTQYQAQVEAEAEGTDKTLIEKEFSEMT